MAARGTAPPASPPPGAETLVTALAELLAATLSEVAAARGRPAPIPHAERLALSGALVNPRSKTLQRRLS